MLYRTLLLQPKRKPLHEPKSTGVREERVVYAVEWNTPLAARGPLH